MRFPRLLSRAIVPAVFLAVASVLAASAEELEVQPTPFTALLDFTAIRHPAARSVPQRGMPIWMEGVDVEKGEPRDEGDEGEETVFRVRLRRMPGLNDTILLRLFFDDQPGKSPTVTAWSETGNQKFASPPLGAGLALPASESLAIPVSEADYLEIRVPGDGSSLRQAIVATLRKAEVDAALDFAPPSALADPFGNDIPATPEEIPADTFLFGRVRAMLEPGPLKLAPATGESAETGVAHLGFELMAEPLLAIVTFEVLNADPAAPLLAWANGEPAGAVNYRLPDLADPGYTGIARPLEKMSFRYSGWIRCQKAIPGRLLRTGENTFTLQVPAEAGPVAIRNVELQLKHHWQKLDYTLSPR